MSSVIEYKLSVDEYDEVRFPVSLELDADDVKSHTTDNSPEWTHLENNKCGHCPLSAEEYACCPLAIRVIPFVEELGHLNSVDEIKVTVDQGERSKQMIAPVQDILGSLLGLFMATSECPYTQFLRPMAHFHLPLADPDETLYRVLSMYRLGQYFKKSITGRAYSDFGELEDHYANLVEVNHKLSQRMRAALGPDGQKHDGAINAIILLDALSQYVPASIGEAVEELEPIFKAYWEHIED